MKSGCLFILLIVLSLHTKQEIGYETTNVRYLHIRWFRKYCEDDKCLVLWCDKTFTTAYHHEPDGGSGQVGVNKVYDNAEEFLETIKKELI